MDIELEMPSMNAFFIEDPNQPGTWAIPVVVVNGDKVMLNNIRKERLDYFRPIVAAIAEKTGTKAYFVEYETPSLMEVIEPANNPDIHGVLICVDGPPTASEIKTHFREFIEKLDDVILNHVRPEDENEPDEETVH